jgi:Mg2+ and Co2+ transporter CorA
MDVAQIRQKAIEISKANQNDDEFLRRIMESEPEIIAALMPLLSNRDSAMMLESRRDLCKTILQTKMTGLLTGTMIKLDRSANFLAWVGISLTIIIGVAQIAVPIYLQNQVAQPIAETDAANPGPGH